MVLRLRPRKLMVTSADREQVPGRTRPQASSPLAAAIVVHPLMLPISDVTHI
jgi:hypothetical protein